MSRRPTRPARSGPSPWRRYATRKENATKKTAPDGPAREGRQADRQEHDPPEDGAQGRLPQEEAVDGAAGQGRDARGGEQEGEEVAQPPAGGLAAEEETGEHRALERHAVIREGDVGLGQARRS